MSEATNESRSEAVNAAVRTNGAPTGKQPISELLEAAAAGVVPIVRAIDDAQLANSTPCAEYDVRKLLNHLIQVVINFQALAARQDVKFDDSADYLSGDWRTRFAEETRKLIGAWAVAGAEDGTTGAMGLPARTVGHMVLGDLTVHAWDLARATGQEYTVPSAVLDETGSAFTQMAPMARKAGVFGEPVPVPGDASDLDKLLAATGRDPRWTR